jgi:hypothetical protein
MAYLSGPRQNEDMAELADAGTVIIAVKDQVLADSLRFSLELEGYEARLCKPTIEQVADLEIRTCLLVDQEVFATLRGRGDTGVVTRFDLPTVLMVNQRTRRVMDYAKAAGVTAVLEKPLLGGVLFDAIRSVLDGKTP